MISIMRRFSVVLPSFVIQSYNEYESVHMIKGISTASIPLIVAYIIDPVSKPATIVYSSKAKTDRVTLLYFVEL